MKFIDPDISRDMLYEFTSEMNANQLEKLASYAGKLWADKRYKNNKNNKPKRT